MQGIDKATAAFDADMGLGNNSSRGSNDDGGRDNGGPVEALFDREHETDVIAGGDELPDPAPIVEDDDDVDDSYIEDDDETDPSDDDIEDDSDDEDEGDDEDDEDSDDFEKSEFDIVVDGKPAKVSGKEMKEGYIRMETFHQRMNKLHEAGVQMERYAHGLQADRTELDSKLAEAEEIIKSLVPDEPDWEKLFDTDPVAARKTQKTYESIQATLKKVQDARTENSTKLQTENDTRYNNWVRTEQTKVMANNPDWKGDKGQEKMQRDLKAMADTALAAGFTEKEIKGTHDSRMITILKKAAAYDRLQKKRVKPVSGKNRGKPRINHGAGSVRTAPKGTDRAQRQLRRSGSLEDAAAVFGNVLASEGKRRRR